MLTRGGALASQSEIVYDAGALASQSLSGPCVIGSRERRHTQRLTHEPFRFNMYLFL